MRGKCRMRFNLLATTAPKTNPIQFSFLTPRNLPRAETLAGRVAVLDIAFASEGGGSSFEGVPASFGVAADVAAWVTASAALFCAWLMASD